MTAQATGRALPERPFRVADVKRALSVAAKHGLRVTGYTVNAFTGEITVLTEAADKPSVRAGEAAWDKDYPAAA